MPAPTLESAFVRILINDSAGRAAAGAGFLAAPRHVLTCAHVVNTALRRTQTAPEQPDMLLALDFPLLPDQILLHAKVLRWFPVRENAAVGELEDIAVLELPEDAPLPVGAQPAPLVLFEEHWGRQVRLQGFSVPASTCANLTLQGLNTQGLIELHHQGSGVVAPGFSGTAVWSVQENAVCGMAVAVWKELNTAYMIPAAALIQAFPELDRCSRPVNPYRGMEAFREKDARFYFGRETDADELRKKVEQQPFTAVIGASGSGKSSLVFAGLLPILRQSGDWLLAACRPKQQPFHELAACLIPFLYEDELERVKKSRQCAADLLSGELHLSDLLQRIAKRNDCRRFLLLVDQFEELYTLNADMALARAFAAQLLAAQAEGFRAVITLRADFLEAALGDEAFAKTLNACQPLYLSPLGSHGLRLAVERPAELFGIRFEAGLADLIVADVGTEPGSLPLLEFCLTQLWEQQAFRQISHAAYKSIGGVRQALARHADTVLAEFEQEAVRRIFLKLVRPGQGTEDTRQVAALADFQEEQRGLIKQLADRRLLVTSGDEAGQQVEVAHEALIRHWQTLRKWVDAERDFLVWRDKLRVLLRQWQESGHDEGALLRGLPLGEALQWRGSHAEHLDEKELRFIRESEAARRKQRRRKGIAAGAGLLLAVAVMVVFFVLWKDAERQKVVAEQKTVEAQKEKDNAEQQTLTANYNLAKAFEEKALTSLKVAEEKNDIGAYKKSILFSSAAMEQKNNISLIPLTPLSTGKLFSAKIFKDTLTEQWILSTPEKEIVDEIFFSPDNKMFACLSNSGVRLLDTKTGKELSVVQKKDADEIAIAFSRDSVLLIATSSYGKDIIQMLDATTGKNIKTFVGHNDNITNISLSRNGKILASSSMDKTLRIWDTENGKQIMSIKMDTSNLSKIKLSSEGNLLGLLGDDGKYMQIWNLKTGKMIEDKYWPDKNKEMPFYFITFSDDERFAAYSYMDKEVRLLNIKTGDNVEISEECCSDNFSFSHDGRLMVCPCGAKVQLIELKTEKKIKLLGEDKEDVATASFSPNGKLILSTSNDGKIRLWNIESERELKIPVDFATGASFSPNGKILTISPSSWLWDSKTGKKLTALQPSVASSSFSPNGNMLACTDYDSDIWLTDTVTGKTLRVLKGHTDDIIILSFSPDSRILASGSEDKTVRLWDSTSGNELMVLKGHTESVNSLSFSPDGKRIASASDDKTIRIWNVKTGYEIKVLKGHNSVIKSVSFSPDGKTLASGSWDRTIRIWDSIDGEEIKILLQDNLINSIAFSPDGKWLASGSDEDEFMIHIWDYETFNKIIVLDDSNIAGAIKSVSLSPDNRSIVSAHGNSTEPSRYFGPSGDSMVWVRDISPYTLFLQGAKPTPLYHTFIEAVKFLWELDVQGLEIVHKERTPADMERFGSLLAPPPSGQSKFDQVLEWAEKQQGK